MVILSAFLAVFVASHLAEHNTLFYWVVDISVVIITMSIWYIIFHKLDKKRRQSKWQNQRRRTSCLCFLYTVKYKLKRLYKRLTNHVKNGKKGVDRPLTRTNTVIIEDKHGNSSSYESTTLTTRGRIENAIKTIENRRKK